MSSVPLRFGVSLLANAVRSAMSFATGLLLARWLGPGDYGRMVFLLASFAAFRALVDMGTSSAFFTLLSQRPRSRKFIAAYWYWVVLQLAISVLLVAWVFPDSFIEHLWIGESRAWVVLALVATFMQGSAWAAASQMGEASRNTIGIQRLNVLVTLLHLSVVCALWWVGQLAIPTVFGAMALEWGLAAWLAARLYSAQGETDDIEENGETVRSAWREYFDYCRPLIPYAWLCFAHDFLDRWMLQKWGGAQEQAYFGVAQQFAGAALLATSSLLSIFWKEIAEANYRQNRERVHLMYVRASKLLYLVGAFVAGTLIPWTGEILNGTVGQHYERALTPLLLMFLYPIHQSIGQIGGTMLYATGHVRLQVKLGAAFMVTSLIASYFMLAPADALLPGLALGSQGLALKMAILQVIQVNIVTWVIARIFVWKFEWLFQIGALSVCLAGGVLACWITKVALPGTHSAGVLILFSGGLSCLLVGAAIYAQPWIAGLSRVELRNYARRILSI